MPYWDTNVPWTPETSTKQYVETAIERKFDISDSCLTCEISVNILIGISFFPSVGYDGIVFTHSTDKLSGKDACKIQKVTILDPTESVPPGSSNVLRLQKKLPQQHALRMKSSQWHRGEFQQLTRINVVMMDQAQQHGLNSTNNILLGYDLVSVTPANDKILHTCIQNDNIDIISFDFSQRLPFYLKLTPVKMAIERGIMFEVTYSACFRDSAARRNFVSNCMHLLFLTRGKNVIFSSGAQRVLDMRNPAEVLNLAVMCNIPAALVSDVLHKNVYSALKHAETRRTLKAVVSVVKRGAEEDIEAESKRSKTEE